MTDLLKRDAYTSADWFKREQDELFSKSWQFALLESDVPNPGDYTAIQLGQHPIVILRLKDGEIGAYYNICRHRGTTLMEGSGNAGKSIVCPYHRWTYALDGRLKGVPNMSECFGELDRASLGLKPCAVGAFKGLVFVNPDVNAHFESFIAPIMNLAWPHDLSAKDLKEAATLIYDMKCDWKVFAENAIDGYHLAYLHENTLGGPLPAKNIWERHQDHMIWYATDEDGKRHSLPEKSRKEAKAVWAKPLKDTTGQEFGGVYFLFPNTIITPTPYTFSVSRLNPISAGKSELHIRHFVGPWQSKDERKYIPGYNSKTGRISSDNWIRHPLETNDFQTEDVWICEKIQTGLNSSAYELGPLSNGPGAEDPIRWFHKSIRQYL